jgi:hypothetical protein
LLLSFIRFLLPFVFLLSSLFGAGPLIGGIIFSVFSSEHLFGKARGDVFVMSAGAPRVDAIAARSCLALLFLFLFLALSGPLSSWSPIDGCKIYSHQLCNPARVLSAASLCGAEEYELNTGLNKL